MRYPRLASWFLVALAALTVLGHICALPFHVHAGAIATHEEGTSHHGDEDADAIHSASCDVVKSTSAGLDRPAVAQAGVARVVVVRPMSPPEVASSPVVFGSPPLFLLHAALLI